ncbi:iron-enterobactin ABC transporter permease [Martelella alba]|uniref:iron-enterobactin ABC transporter permease n=1 Tax=Martelella alba TaxID=2590451 RepID=UPI001485BAD7|nr:iron-enterobactin ABC transporter permease [Martelella alba]
MNRPSPLRIRRPLAGGFLALCCLAMAVTALGTGSLSLDAAHVLAALSGLAPEPIQTVVVQWRLPRVAAALMLGAALGVSGGIFQSLLRNPLGSPDVLGFNTGAHSGVLLAIVALGGDDAALPPAALAGGGLTALAVFLLAWRDGIHTLRLIIVGIAVRALLVALNTWLIISASLESAMTAGLWSAGSLNGMTWAKCLPAALMILPALLLTSWLVRPMRLMEMGEDAARALGVSVERSRFGLILAAVALTAAATAAAGPISFVALAAPQIARRLSASQTPSLTLAALTGALVLLAADLASRRLFTPYQLPVGVVTVSLGGLYLIALLIRETRAR